MKIIVNTSNIVVGGGVQVSISVINELKFFDENQYYIFLSAKVKSQIKIKDFPENFHFYDIISSPSSIIKRRSIIKKLNLLESKINPDIVFTIFGPSYWSPKSVHISGFADGWCYNPKSIAFKKLTIKNYLYKKAIILYKNYFIKKASFLIVETEIAKKNIVKYLKVNESRIFVVGNTNSNYFTNYKKEKRTNNLDFKLLTVSSYYAHKNLEIINDVDRLLRLKSPIEFKFYLTLSNKNFNHLFLESDTILNLGPQKNEDCPRLYNNVDAVFLPSLLETFSANYPEAMIMERPILTSDMDFSKYVCEDAAIYFNPLNANDISDKIIELQKNRKLYSNKVTQGLARLKTFETSRTRVNKYLKIFKNITENNVN